MPLRPFPRRPRLILLLGALLTLALATTAAAQPPVIARADHLSGVEVQVLRLEYDPEATRIEVEAVNHGRHRARLNGQGSTHLVDNLGRTYALRPPAGDDRLVVEPGGRRTWRLEFAGPVRGRVESLYLVFNDRYVGGDRRGTRSPKLVLTLPTPEEQPGPGLFGRQPLAAESQGGLTLKIWGLETGGRDLLLTVEAINDRRREVQLHGRGDTVLRDDQGYQYPLQTPGHNPRLAVGPGQRLETRLAFAGPLRDQAARLFLVTNEVPGGAIDPRRPQFRLEIPLASGPGAPPWAGGGVGSGEVATGGYDDASPPQSWGLARLEGALDARREARGLVVTLLTDEIFTGDQEVTPEGTRKLIQVAELIRRLDNPPVLVEGHSDARGGRLNNLTLSQRRADAVVQWLVERAGLQGAFTSRGLGEQSPVADNQTADGRRLNRRVEVIIQAQ